MLEPNENSSKPSALASWPTGRPRCPQQGLGRRQQQRHFAAGALVGRPPKTIQPSFSGSGTLGSETSRTTGRRAVPLMPTPASTASPLRRPPR
jgi:hypothetical protein